MDKIYDWIRGNFNVFMYTLIAVLWGIDLALINYTKADTSFAFTMLYGCYVMLTISVITIINRNK